MVGVVDTEPEGMARERRGARWAMVEVVETGTTELSREGGGDIEVMVDVVDAWTKEMEEERNMLEVTGTVFSEVVGAWVVITGFMEHVTGGMKVRLSMEGAVVEERLETWGLGGGRERLDMSSVSLSSQSAALVGSTAPHPAGESGLAILLVQGGGVETLWGEGEAIVAQL